MKTVLAAAVAATSLIVGASVADARKSSSVPAICTVLPAITGKPRQWFGWSVTTSADVFYSPWIFPSKKRAERSMERWLDKRPEISCGDELP